MTVGDWELFEDWCTATAHVAMPTTWETVQAFLEDTDAAQTVVARRLAAIRARHERARHDLVGAPSRAAQPLPWRPPGQLVNVFNREGRRWLGLPTALHQLPVHGWPHAVAARRDAVVLVLAARGWSRRQITDLRPGQVRLEPVPAVDDIDLPMTNHGLTCSSCALTRWLRVLAAVYSRIDETREHLADAVEDQPADVRQHDCGLVVPTGWERAPWVLPSIDAHGRIQLNSHLPARRVSAVLAARQRGPQNTIRAEPPVTPVPKRQPPSLAERTAVAHAIDEVLDDLDAAIDAVIGRSHTLLDSADSTVITPDTGRSL